MTQQELIADLRSRINPAYAATRGTESCERRLVCEALEAQAAEINRLRATLAQAGDLLFSLWDARSETETMHLRYAKVQHDIEQALQ